MKRGDIVTVAAPGDYGKPRPAVVILADELIDRHASISFCQFTTTINEIADYRVLIEPSVEKWLACRITDHGRQAVDRRIPSHRPRDRPPE